MGVRGRPPPKDVSVRGSDSGGSAGKGSNPSLEGGGDRAGSIGTPDRGEGGALDVGGGGGNPPLEGGGGGGPPRDGGGVGAAAPLLAGGGGGAP